MNGSAQTRSAEKCKTDNFRVDFQGFSQRASKSA
jgi:hypothetical protein